jgi:hypothetical protein
MLGFDQPRMGGLRYFASPRRFVSDQEHTSRKQTTGSATYLREPVPGMKAELIFSRDEMCMSEWEDGKSKWLIVPKTIARETVHQNVSRGVKHIWIVACITAAGESLMSYIVAPHNPEPLRKRPIREVVRIDIDLVLKQRSKRYLDANLFLGYVNTIFVPYLTERHGT